MNVSARLMLMKQTLESASPCRLVAHLVVLEMDRLKKMDMYTAESPGNSSNRGFES